jgi:hypothetical protein
MAGYDSGPLCPPAATDGAVNTSRSVCFTRRPNDAISIGNKADVAELEDGRGSRVTPRTGPHCIKSASASPSVARRCSQIKRSIACSGLTGHTTP